LKEKSISKYATRRVGSEKKNYYLPTRIIEHVSQIIAFILFYIHMIGMPTKTPNKTLREAVSDMLGGINIFE
jgi:hypothetical protein